MTRVTWSEIGGSVAVSETIEELKRTNLVPPGFGDVLKWSEINAARLRLARSTSKQFHR